MQTFWLTIPGGPAATMQARQPDWGESLASRVILSLAYPAAQHGLGKHATMCRRLPLVMIRCDLRLTSITRRENTNLG